ncbi:hypothetical protein chiPu_0022278 [Chiloscyllium punctatum]|uniref:Uncharacterized protein n=1 Tax=Chiloscyllium punctatum TaxID=137246 RepID=A0A401RGV9_CHIPU|nr:hypothetical protein [Chiloscyllium punctatum]
MAAAAAAAAAAYFRPLPFRALLGAVRESVAGSAAVCLRHRADAASLPFPPEPEPEPELVFDKHSGTGSPKEMFMYVITAAAQLLTPRPHRESRSCHQHCRSGKHFTLALLAQVARSAAFPFFRRSRSVSANPTARRHLAPGRSRARHVTQGGRDATRHVIQGAGM